MRIESRGWAFETDIVPEYKNPVLLVYNKDRDMTYPVASFRCKATMDEFEMIMKKMFGKEEEK